MTDEQKKCFDFIKANNPKYREMLMILRLRHHSHLRATLGPMIERKYLEAQEGRFAVTSIGIAARGD